MKICYLLATQGDWGGLEKHVFDLASAMVGRGHEVIVVCDSSYAEYCPAGVHVAAFDWRGSRRNIWLRFKLKKLLLQLAPNIIHAHADKPAYLLSKIHGLKGAQTLATIHNIKSNYSAYKKFKTLIGVSSAIAKSLGRTDVNIIYNGVFESHPNLEVVKKIKGFLNDKPAPYFVAVGRLVEAKGFDLLLQSWPNSRAGSLFIIGDGKQKETLQQLIDERELKSVYLIGHSSEVAEWMTATDFLMISSRNEGGPYTLSEALLSKLAVVGTKVGMVPDFLPASHVVAPNNIDALQDLLASVIQDPDHYQDACKSAFIEAKETLSFEAMTNKTEQVYRTMMAEIKY